jgi:[ribosomal protein S5]-alanine N-acetyltransferase
MIKYTGIYHSLSNITIVPLSLVQLQLLLTDKNQLLQTLQLPAQKLYQPHTYNEITENVIIPAVKKNAAHWFYHTKWLGIETATQQVVGELILRNGGDKKNAVELGYTIYPVYKGKGLMTQVVACFIDWARTASILKAIKAATENDNEASVRVLEKNGFVQISRPGSFTWWQLNL